MMKIFDNKKFFILVSAVISLGFVYGDIIAGLDYDFDNILNAMRTPTGLSLWGYITLLGDKYFLSVISILLSYFIYRFWTKDTFLLKVFWAAFILDLASGLVMKYFIGRDRPLGSIGESGYSFPSAHAMAAIFVYGFIAILILRMNDMGKKKRYSAAILSVAAFLLVGFSRVYLGVHYLSDVLGGYLIGWFWLNFLVSFFNDIQRDEASSMVKVKS